MVSSLDGIESLAKKLKETLLVKVIENPSSFVSSSAYDTAWVAMVSDPEANNEQPMFKSCLEWVLNNQMQEGFWGERDSYGNPTIDSLPATLACMVALNMWGCGNQHIKKGMEFLGGNLTKLLISNRKGENYPRWFAIAFPGMVELARQRGLQVMFADEIKVDVAQTFSQQQKILKTEESVDKYHSPLLSYLEVMPSYYKIDVGTIINNLREDGSLFGSPAATAAAYMETGNLQSLSYLRNLVHNYNHGVPSMYPVDEVCIKLYMINHLQRLGLKDHFEDEIKVMSEDIYSKYNEQEAPQHCLIDGGANIFNSSLAFEVLRHQGYNVSPWKFCGFLNDEYALKHIEDNQESFASMLYNLYRATNLMFESETELKEMRLFSRNLLAKSCLYESNIINDGIMIWPHLQEGIKREILVPWMARMDHLDHREWIEANKDSPLWLGKASYYRMSCLGSIDLLQLAKEHYEHRQMVYRKELIDLVRWSKLSGIADMGFARDKTTYCYFAIASSAPSIPCDSDIRLMVTKSAVIITVFDDFFDMEGSLNELQILTKAVQRWDNSELKSHTSKILFNVLDNFVDEVAKKYLAQNQIDITSNLREIWYEVVASWLTEATWSRTGQVPSMASYVETGKISIAAHILALQASCFLNPSLCPHYNLNPSQYEAITEHLMTSCRLLNDMQSYEKEARDGKLNSVTLHLKENPNEKMEDAIEYVRNLLEGTKMRLLEQALMYREDDKLPRSSKMLHLSTLKVFQMFFNAANHFDSKDSILKEINKAIFVPFEDQTPLEPPKPLSIPSRPKKVPSIINSRYDIDLKFFNRRSNFTMHQIPSAISTRSHTLKLKISPSLSFRFA